MQLRALFPDAKVRLCLPSICKKILYHIHHKLTLLCCPDYIMPFFYKVACLVQEKPKDINLMMAPVRRYLFQSIRVKPCMQRPVACFWLFSDSSTELCLVFHHNAHDKLIALHHLVHVAKVFIGIGCIHYITEPEYIIPSCAVRLSRIKRSKVSSIN